MKTQIMKALACQVEFGLNPKDKEKTKYVCTGQFHSCLNRTLAWYHYASETVLSETF